MCCDDSDTIRGLVLFEGEYYSFQALKKCGGYNSRAWTGKHHMYNDCVSIDAHVLTSGSCGGHYLRADTILSLSLINLIITH